MITRRGLFVLGFPIVATLALFLAGRSLRQPTDSVIPSRRAVHVAGDAPVPDIASTHSAPLRRGSNASAPAGGVKTAKPRVVLDIATAAENARIQSTYQNYRTATMTENKPLQKTLLSVLQRDREIAMGYAREHAAMAETESDRAFALRTLSELGR